MVKRQKVKSCCGTSKTIIFFDSAFTKEHLAAFHAHGYVSPPHYARSGLMYLKKDKLIATCSFGSKRVSTNCASNNCDKLLDEFESLAVKILNASKI